MRRMFAWMVASVLLALGFSAPASAQNGRWLRAESPHFIVYGDNGERNLREAVQGLESFHAAMTQLLQPPERDAVKLEVYLFRSRRDLLAVWPDASRWVGGFYQATPDYVGAVAMQTVSMRDFADEILLHEYAHHFMWQYYTAAYPAWFVEGFAEFVQTAEVRERDVRIGRASDSRVYVLGQDIPNIRDVLQPPDRITNLDISQYYAASWLMTHYLVENAERMQGFIRYMAALQAGGDAIEAFEPAFGVSITEFQNELRRYFRSGMRGFVLPAITVPDSDIHFTPMPEAADRLLPLMIQMRRGVWAENEEARQRAASDLAARVEQEAARFPNDPYALRALAWANITRGDYVQARTVLAPVITANPDDIDAQFLTGLTYVREAGAGDMENYTATAAPARRHFARVFRLNDRHVPTLYNYAATHAMEPGPMDEGALDVLTQAHLLAPQVAEIRFNLASELIEARRFDEAELVIEPLALSPHPNAMTRQARVLLEAAKRDEFPTPEAMAAAMQEPVAEAQ